jgi:hypothetical protein
MLAEDASCKPATLRASLYADDASIFVNPTRSDILAVAEILDIFGNTSGLITNRSKCVVFPIRCEGLKVSI